ncbi:MAG: zinc ribbon domain-containing protein [Candidatus Bathyarchaeia archaeon]
MPYCEKCGAQISEEDQHCPSCGNPVKPGERVRPRRERGYTRERDLCFRREEPRGDPLDIVEFGLFLLIVGVVYISNPDILSGFISWVRLMADLGTMIRPPTPLTSSAVLFFALIGFSNLLTASIRVMVDKVWRRILSDILAGIGLLLFAYLINLYGQHIITWTNVIAIIAIVFGALVIAYSLLRNLFH